MKFFLFIFFLLSTQAKLLDKISAVVDGDIITLSMIKRVQSSLPARKNISPFIYKKDKYTNAEVSNLLVRRKIIRTKLAELGYIISDEQVESEIKNREQKLGLTRSQLLQFLKNNNTNYDEFFEITREALEFNIFNSRIILPLISISEQEIKNAFYKENSNNKSITYKYTLVDFTHAKPINKSEYKDFKEAMTNFQKGRSLPTKFKDVTPNELGGIKVEDLAKNLQNVIKKTNEGEFTDPIEIFGDTHIFFVKKRDIVESDVFLQEKNRIRSKLYQDKATQITDVWFQRESLNHYIKKFL